LGEPEEPKSRAISNRGDSSLTILLGKDYTA
jgi:hypothetical protein